MPPVAPPSPQEIHRKLSIHSVARVKSSNTSAGPVSGTESDSDSNYTADVVSPGSHMSTSLGGTSSSLPPLSSIAERRSGSGEDSEDEEDVAEGGWKTADVKKKPRDSADESVIKSGYLWKKGERRKTWKKRWFVLRPAHLAYYKSSAEYQLLRLLELSDVHSCTRVTLKRHDNTFGLISAVRTFYLQAGSPKEVHDWVNAIEDARQTLMTTSTQTSASAPIPIPRPEEDSKTRSVPPVSLSPPTYTHHSIITSSDSEDASPTFRPPPSPSPTQAAFATSSPKVPTTNDSAKVMFSGYLMKCGSKRRNWRKRWFVLTGEKLVYSGSHMDTKPHRQFPFTDILDALEYPLPPSRTNQGITPSTSSPPTAVSAPDGDDSHGSHTFKIVTTKRTLLLCAPSEEDEIKWLGAVRALIARRTGSGVLPGASLKGGTQAPVPDTSSSLISGGNIGTKHKIRHSSAGGLVHEGTRER